MIVARDRHPFPASAVLSFTHTDCYDRCFCAAAARDPKRVIQRKDFFPGFNFQSGDFGNRYGWYVQVVNSKVSNNWYTMEIGPAVNARRVYITFDIERDGSPSNVRIEQSSGVPALDQSAVRAVQRIDTFGPPPSGNKVSVEFWFDYQR